MSSVFMAQSRPLRGIILRDEEDRVVVQASPADVRHFAAREGQAVDVRQVDVRIRMRRNGVAERHVRNVWSSPPPETVGTVRPMDLLYNADGHPVARIDELVSTVDRLEVTNFGDVARQYIEGLATVTITATGLPGVRVAS